MAKCFRLHVPVLLLMGSLLMNAPGCGVLGCLPVIRPGVEITLTNAETGGLISGAALRLVDGAYQETMTEGGPGVYSGSWGRRGTYTLTVQADGFENQRMEGIVAATDRCGINQTVSLNVQMNPAGG